MKYYPKTLTKKYSPVILKGTVKAVHNKTIDFLCIQKVKGRETMEFYRIPKSIFLKHLEVGANVVIIKGNIKVISKVGDEGKTIIGWGTAPVREVRESLMTRYEFNTGIDETMASKILILRMAWSDKAGLDVDNNEFSEMFKLKYKKLI